MGNNHFAEFQIIGTAVRNFSVKNDFVTLSFNDVKKKIDISHKIVSMENSDDTWTGIVWLMVKATLTQGKRKYKIDMCIEGCFTAPKTMEEEQFVSMLNVNGITSLYSISRGFVQSVTSQTLLEGNVLLPMINVVEYSRNTTDGE